MEASIQTKPVLSNGQKVMRASFNPSKDPMVDEAKQRYADMWDQIELLKNKELARIEKDTDWKNRTAREFAVAQAALEKACVFTIKGLTAHFQD